MIKTHSTCLLQIAKKTFVLGFGAILTFAVTTTARSAPPQVVSSAGLPATSIGLRFNAQMDPTTAAQTGNYTLSGGTPVNSAQLLADGQTVVLGVSQLAGSNYSLTINGVKDTVGDTIANATVNGVILNDTVQDVVGSVTPMDTPSLVYAYAPNIIDAQVQGGAVWNAEDSMNFISRQYSGDFDVQVQCNSISGGDGNSNMQLDARDSSAAGSRHMAITIYGAGHAAQWLSYVRQTAEGASGVLNFGNYALGYPAGAALPNIWMRIKRVGNTITTYASTNGVTWTQVGDAFTSNFPATMAVGLDSNTTDYPTATPVLGEYANFSDYSLTNAAITITTQPQNLAVVQLTPATFTVSATLTNGQPFDLDYTWYSNNVAVAEGSAASYTITQTPLSASGSHFYVVISAPGVAPLTSSVVTLTVQSDNTAPQVVSSAGLPGTSIGIRFNKQLDPTTSAQAANYTLSGGIPIDSAQLLDDGVTVVLGVSQLTGVTNYSLTINGVQDLVGNATVNLVATGRVLNYSVVDIVGNGSLAAPSLVYSISNHMAGMHVNGGAVWFNSDSFNYVYQSFTNDFDVRVQCSKVSGGDQNSNMALDARDSTYAGSRHVALCIYASSQNRWVAYGRSAQDGGSGVLNGNWGLNYPAGDNVPNVWIRMQRVGNTITTFGSTDDATWTQVGDGVTSSFPSVMVVGMNTVTSDVGVPAIEAEYSNFGNYTLSNALITITSGPENVAVSQLRPATFTVVASITNGQSTDLAYTWYSNNVMVAEGTLPSYTVAQAPLSSSGSKFYVVVSAPGTTPVTSTMATLTVQADNNPPQVVSTAGLPGTNIGIRFNKQLDPNSSSQIGNYTLSGGIPIDSAQLESDGLTVVLSTSQLTNVSSYTLTINGVQDLIGNAANNLSVTGKVLNYTVQDVMGGPTPIDPSLVYAYATNVLDVQVQGGQVWNNGDSMNFISQQFTGDFDVQVQCNKISGGDGNSNMQLDARDSAYSGSRHMAITIYVGRNYWVSYTRQTTDGSSSVLNFGNYQLSYPNNANLPNVWMRIRRSGNTLTTYGSSDGVTWLQVGDVFTSTNLPATMSVGLDSNTTDYPTATPLLGEYSNFGSVPAVVVSPQLQAVVTNGNIVLSWPASVTGFQVQSSSKLGTGASWGVLNLTPVTVGNNQQVTQPIGTGSMFFRLVH